MKIVYEYWTERLKPLLLAMFFWYSSSMAVSGDGVTWTDRLVTGRVGPGRRLQLTPSAALIQPVVSNFHPRSPDMGTRGVDRAPSPVSSTCGQRKPEQLDARLDGRHNWFGKAR